MASPVQPGDVLLEKYRVERILGEGGMGVVVAVRHVELGELFAVKFLLPEANQQPGAVERFIREARASARLRGEHVAKVHDVGRLQDGLPYMVLEYLAGKDLADILAERGPLPVDEAVTYLLQACEAIAEAHQLGIVHRDLKPANLFVTRRPNGTACVKVLDFGISRQLEPDDTHKHGLTKTGTILGTPHYMSPEQMTRSKEVDPRSDIWSLGCVLYELLTSQVPFTADALTELVAKVLQNEPTPPSVHRADIPPAIEAVVMRCLVKRQELRFQSVQELIEALRHALWSRSQPALASGPSFPTALSSGAMPAVTRPSHVSSTAAGWGSSSSQMNPGLSSPSSRAGLVAVVFAALGIVIGGGAWLAVQRGAAPAEAPSPAAEAPSAPSAPEEGLSAAEAPSAAPPPGPSVEPTAAASAPHAPPEQRPASTSAATLKPSPSGAAIGVRTATPQPSKPAAEPPAPTTTKTRNSMY